MKCKFCSAPLPQKGLVCNYCGQRNPLNLNVLSKVDIEEKSADLHCPVCDTAFDNINIGLKERVLVQRCNDCDGIFIIEDILEQLIKIQSDKRKSIDFTVLKFIQENPRQQKESVIKYRNCPVCKNIMQRMNYRAISGVIVDRCLRHGVWLDGGELKQLFEWKKVGGDLKKIHKTPINRKGNTTKSTYMNSNKTSYFDPLGNFFTWLQGG